jgi:hypothetical protein
MLTKKVRNIKMHTNNQSSISDQQLEKYNELMIAAIKRVSAEHIQKIQEETKEKLKEYSQLSRTYSRAS